MQAAHYLFDAGVGWNLIRSSMFPTDLGKCIKQDGPSTLCTAAKRSLPLNGLILLKLQIGNFHTRVWLLIALLDAVEMLLGTAFIDRFMCGIFPSGRRVLPWSSRSVTITVKSKTSNTALKTNLISDKPMSAGYRNKIESDSVYDFERVVKQIERQPNTQQHVLANRQSYGLFTMEPIDLCRHTTLATRGVEKVSPRQPLCILMSNFSNQKVLLPKPMIRASNGATTCYTSSQSQSFSNRDPRGR